MPILQVAPSYLLLIRLRVGSVDVVARQYCDAFLALDR